ncbi:hypothetical protein [Desulfobacterium sp. N47]|uniref:ABC transmembrane type-1 domain-containing protein n=1 Tax=uncultured Desulfobacterium sp. TaxID=201089 RepID=E1YKN2_9BACT|nr:unknown protein [uncultured Desulfobacterium sp.]
MFWSAIIGGLKVLTFWEVYVAALIFTVISIGPMFFFGLIGEKNEAVGCLGGMLIAPVFQALATIIFVFTLFPILLWFAGNAAWSAWLFPWKILLSSPWPMIKVSFMILRVQSSHSWFKLNHLTSIKLLHTLIML